jgi:hypothetical protein
MRINRNHNLLFGVSVLIALLLAAVSLLGLIFGSRGLYGDPASALGPTVSTSGILVPGFLGHDAFNLLVVTPLLVCLVWLARHGSRVALLLWPGALYYLLYTFAIYQGGAPFSALFLLYVALAALSGFTTIALVGALTEPVLSERLQPAVSARVVGGLLVALAIATLGQDVSGAIATASAGGAPLDVVARPVWSADLCIEVPAVLIGGVLLWRRHPLGYISAGGLLLQYGLTPLALAWSLALQGLATGSTLDWLAILGVLVFAVICFAAIGLIFGREPHSFIQQRPVPEFHQRQFSVGCQ